MQLTRRFRIPALLCALAVLACELISRPFSNMGICDDGPYILVAQKLAASGQVVYNGAEAAMMGWQLYLGAAFIKLFGFSLTTVRMSTLLVAMAVAFLLQRTLVRANISERNATIGTLALVLSPLYLMLSATFMTDIFGLFAIVLCLYGCLRALQAPTPRSTIAWLCFAVATNAICGTSRQIAWLGILVMVPSTLWLLRGQRRVLLAGAAATIAGSFFILGCMQWLKQQRYVIPEHILTSTFPVGHISQQFIELFLDVPFFLLPIVAMFIPEIRKSRPYIIAIISALLLTHLFVAMHPGHFHYFFLLEPTGGGPGSWVGIHGTIEILSFKGQSPLFLHHDAQVVLTITSFGGLLGMIASFLRSRRTPSAVDLSPGTSSKQLGVLLTPFIFGYALFLIPPAAGSLLFDRYLLPLLVIALICSVRYYQDRIRPRLPLAGVLLVGAMAIYGIAVTHNMFALERAREGLATEFRADGVPDTSVDSGWDYNFDVELQHAKYINDPRLEFPVGAYVPIAPLPVGTCPMFRYDETPHIHPVYGISFDPTACYGLAPFAPVHYSRWLASKPGTLYVVNYLPPSKP